VLWIASVFSPDEADDAALLTQGKEDNEVRRKKMPQDMVQFSRGSVLGNRGFIQWFPRTTKAPLITQGCLLHGSTLLAARKAIRARRRLFAP